VLWWSHPYRNTTAPVPRTIVSSIAMEKKKKLLLSFLTGKYLEFSSHKIDISFVVSLFH